MDLPELAGSVQQQQHSATILPLQPDHHLPSDEVTVGPDLVDEGPDVELLVDAGGEAHLHEEQQQQQGELVLEEHQHRPEAEGLQLTQEAIKLDNSDDDDDDDDDDVAAPVPEGVYDPGEWDNLSVSAEVKDLFGYIMRYTPQTTDLEFKFRPFIPDYIPAVGDIDAFIKVARPDAKAEVMGLTVLDEPSAKQSDPSVLELQLIAVTKQTAARSVKAKRIDPGEQGTKAIEKWIKDISDLHRSKPPPTVHYQRQMPDIDTLMQEWPADMEELLKETGLPTADFSADLTTYVDVACSLLDIPVYKSRVQALHVLFSLYSAFKSSHHFGQLAQDNNMDNRLKFERLELD